MHIRQFLLLAALGLLGFLAASEASDAPPRHAVQGEAAPAPAPAPVPVMDGLKIPYKDYAKRVRSRWM